MEFPLCVTCSFFLAAFNILSLCLVSVSLINMCLGMFLLVFILYGTLCSSCTCFTISFSILGKFSTIISSQIFSYPFSSPLAFFLSCASYSPLTFHCRISGSMWMITPSWLYRSLRFLFVYFLCVFLQRTSCKMSGWVKHKLESRLLENINNLRCADDTTLIAESKEELKSVFMNVKEKSEEDGLKNSMFKN